MFHKLEPGAASVVWVATVQLSRGASFLRANSWKCAKKMSYWHAFLERVFQKPMERLNNFDWMGFVSCIGRSAAPEIEIPSEWTGQQNRNRDRWWMPWINKYALISQKQWKRILRAVIFTTFQNHLHNRYRPYSLDRLRPISISCSFCLFFFSLCLTIIRFCLVDVVAILRSV